MAEWGLYFVFLGGGGGKKVLLVGGALNHFRVYQATHHPGVGHRQHGSHAHAR